MGIILASSTAVNAAESGGMFSKLAGMGTIGTVALLLLAGLGLLALLLMLIGWVGALAEYQEHGGIARTVLWVAVVLCLPLLGTSLWAVFGRRRQAKAAKEHADVAPAPVAPASAATASEQPVRQPRMLPA